MGNIQSETLEKFIQCVLNQPSDRTPNDSVFPDPISHKDWLMKLMNPDERRDALEGAPCGIDPSDLDTMEAVLDAMAGILGTRVGRDPYTPTTMWNYGYEQVALKLESARRAARQEATLQNVQQMNEAFDGHTSVQTEMRTMLVKHDMDEGLVRSPTALTQTLLALALEGGY